MQKIGMAVSKVSGSAPSGRGSAPLVRRVPFNPAKLPATTIPKVDVDLPRALWSGWIPADGSPREIVRPLDAEERRQLEARAAQIAPALVPYLRPEDDDDVALALTDLFGGYPSMRDRGDDVLGKVDSAMRLLAPFPRWAIERATLSIRTDGYVTKDAKGRERVELHWPPSDGEIVREVRRVMRHFAGVYSQCVALLAAPVRRA